jgi:hypothetical protein
LCPVAGFDFRLISENYTHKMKNKAWTAAEDDAFLTTDTKQNTDEISWGI